MTIMKSSPNQTVTAGTSSVAIECIVSLAIYNFTACPSTVTWYKDNVRLTEIGTSSKYSYINNNATLPMKLLIHHLGMDDSGVYTCKHEAANQTLVCKALLLVTQKVSQPSCKKELRPVLLADSGDHKELQCPRDDDEEDVVCLWYKNAIPIAHLNNSHVYEDDGDLVFDKMSIQDTGLYQVMLKNDAGQCMTRFPIYVRVKDFKWSTVAPSSTSCWMSIKSSIYSTPRIAAPTTSVISLPITSLFSPRTIDSTTSHSSPSPTYTPTTLATPVPTFTTTYLSTPIPTSYMPTPIPTSYMPTPIPTSTTTYLSTPIPTSYIQKPIPTSTSTYLQTSTTSQTTDEPGIEGTTGASDRVTNDAFHTTQSASNLNKENKSDDLLMWIASGSGGFVVLATVVIATICCSCKRKRRRKRNLEKNADLFEEMEMTFNKRSGKQAVDHSGIQGDPPKGVDTKLLLNDDESLYAPVLALDNAALNFEDTFLLQNPLVNRNSAHMYDEPIKVQRKPYNKPLPTLPRTEDLQRRRSSSHSYLELLGPNDNLNALTDKPKIVPEENLYDCARDGVLTDTLRRIKNQQLQPLYQVLEKTDNTCANRESTLYASAEDVLPEPVYHVLEPSRPESMYQALVEYAPNPIEQPLDDSIYQPLDKKARSTSAPSSTLLASKMKSKRPSSSGHVMKSADDEQYSRSYPEYKADGGCYVYSDDLYQPLNNTERCPLNVSKPKNSTLPFPSQVRKGSLPLVEGKEPTMHAIDVSPRGSLKKNEKQTKKPGHRRNLSDTHTIVNISRLTQRRASAGDGLGLGCDMPFPGRTKRFHSDAGLCPIDLSLLRVSIDFESEGNLGKPSKIESDRNSGEYMPLVKPRDSNENQENVYSSLDDNSVKT